MIYYISPTGDNANDGSEANPWETMAYAYNNSTTGDTIHCLAGTYTMVNQTFGTERTVTGADAKTTIFNGGGGAVTWRTSPVMTISNIHFTNHAQASVIYSVSASIVSLSNCIFSDFISSGFQKPVIRMASGSTYTIISCLFYDCITTYANPIFGHSALIQGLSSTVTCTITNTTFYIVYNPATPNYAIPFGGASVATVFIVKNNIFMNAGSTSIFLTNYNTISDDSSNNCVYGYSNYPTRDGTVAEDPKMIDPANANFNLASDSPCIDTGILI